jgi:hypothetical protein
MSGHPTEQKSFTFGNLQLEILFASLLNRQGLSTGTALDLWSGHGWYLGPDTCYP